MNTPIERANSLADQVYSMLKERILTGEVDPGSRLVETQMAKDLAMSRSPVREAIRRLEHEGLVLNDQGMTTIFKPTKKDFEDLYELRLAIEPAAARLAAKRLSKEACMELEAVLKRSETYLETNQLDPFIECNTLFHKLIVEGSGNRRLQKVTNETATFCRYYRNIVFKIYHRRVTSVDEHWYIYHAIYKRDPNTAWQRMVDHLEGDLSFIQQLGQEGEWHDETFRRDPNY